MTASQIARLSEARRAPRVPDPQQLKTVLCRHKRNNGTYCNREAQPEHDYCWQHVPGVPKKVVALFKAFMRSRSTLG